MGFEVPGEEVADGLELGVENHAEGSLEILRGGAVGGFEFEGAARKEEFGGELSAFREGFCEVNAFEGFEGGASCGVEVFEIGFPGEEKRLLVGAAEVVVGAVALFDGLIDGDDAEGAGAGVLSSPSGSWGPWTESEAVACWPGV
jgi:hypothetical protein